MKIGEETYLGDGLFVSFDGYPDLPACRREQGLPRARGVVHAPKRAQVDLCLTALAASDAFKRQPRPPDPRGTPVSSKDKSSQQGLGDDARAPAATPSAGGVSAPGGRGPVAGSPSSPRPATQAQLGLIRQKLDRAGIAENYFFAQFEIGRFEDLAFERVNQALAWIDELDKGPP